MLQLIVLLLGIVMSCGLVVLGYKMVCFNEARNERYYTIWWWSTGFFVLGVIIEIITAGVVLQRMHF